MKFLVDEFTVGLDDDGDQFIVATMVAPLEEISEILALVGKIVTITEVEDDNDDD